MSDADPRPSRDTTLLAAGITPGLLRVSVGLEDVEDLEADLAEALAAARAATPPRSPAPAAV